MSIFYVYYIFESQFLNAIEVYIINRTSFFYDKIRMNTQIDQIRFYPDHNDPVFYYFYQSSFEYLYRTHICIVSKNSIVIIKNYLWLYESICYLWWLIDYLITHSLLFLDKPDSELRKST